MSELKNTIDKLKKIHIDAIYGKKKHFNAADRKEKYHYYIGIPLIFLNVLVTSELFYLISNNDNSKLLKYIAITITLVTAILSAFQTFFNFNKQIETHRRIANKYLAIAKRCIRIEAYYKDQLIESQKVIDEIEELAKMVDETNIESENCSTNNSDYKLAKKSIEKGEENYTDKELDL